MIGKIIRKINAKKQLKRVTVMSKANRKVEVRKIPLMSSGIYRSFEQRELLYKHVLSVCSQR